MGSDDLAGAARECDALRHAVALAAWVGTGRAVTAKRVLRRADVPVAGRALGVELPKRVRSAADVPALHIPWTAALGAGLLSIEGSRAVAASPVASWRSANPDEVLDLWTRGFVAALTDLFDSDDGSGALEIGKLALTVLAAEPALAGEELGRAIGHVVLEAGHELHRTFHREFDTRDPAEVTLDLLAAVGTVTGTPKRRITPLGRWALSMIDTRGVSLLGSFDDAEGDGTYQLKIALHHVRPACWRRVLMPASATLGELHEVIQIAFAWDDDHLHGFTVGRRRYGDPYFDVEHDEHKTTLATAFARARGPITYIYDFGDDWRHQITREKVLEPAPTSTHPICVDGRGDAPAEDCGDEPAWITFDQAGINTQLARLGSGGREADAQLSDDIEIILTDAYGEHEQMTAFQTVLDAEIDFPVLATLLGNPVVVTGLVQDDATLELRARCKGQHAKGLVSFADLEFRTGTVEAWLHGAYVTHLGRPPSPVTPPAGWDGLARWVS
jgi:hypothetical protein